MTSAEQWRLRYSAALHGFAVLIFAMLALTGAVIATQGRYGLALPMMVAGVAGAGGAAAITAQVWRAQVSIGARPGTGVPGGAGVPGAVAGSERSKPPQRTIRLAMAAAAVVALIAGVLLAPGGIDRGFVISVAALLAAALALFALLAGDRPRPSEPGDLP